MADDHREKPVESPWRRSVRRFSRSGTGVGALVVLVVIGLSSAFAPTLAPYDPSRIDLFNTLAPPSVNHWLGTDENGRDVLSRLMYGGRISLAVGLSSMFAAIILGSVLGALAGFFGGYVDSIISRVIDGMLSVPLFFFLLTALALFGSTLFNLVIVIALTNWMPVARIVRGEVTVNREMQYVESATALGVRPLGILFRHILPQSMPSIIVAATLGVAYAILTESALSYLGLGVRPPTPSWGNMLSDARGYIWQVPMLTVYPGAVIFLAVLAFNAIGDALRDATEPT
ncbi:MAG: ABC transporter permease [Gemmatimonadaceae bacterium]|nr:ABC transporter permease [Gemmatimonadaceae bacterium]